MKLPCLPRTALVIVLATSLAGLASQALAQCVMCARNAEAAADASGGIGPLALAAVVLLVPTMLILAAGVLVTWRMRHPRSPLDDATFVRSGSIVSR